MSAEKIKYQEIIKLWEQFEDAILFQAYLAFNKRAIWPNHQESHLTSLKTLKAAVYENIEVNQKELDTAVELLLFVSDQFAKFAAGANINFSSQVKNVLKS